MTAAKILFAGTPDFARVSLQALVTHGHRPRIVLTQPDRPAGRGKKLQKSAVKVYAEAEGLEVWQPATLKSADIAHDIAALQPDLIVVAAYGLLVPQPILDVPLRGCVNVHASLLPRWRGAAPIQRAILGADTETGVCLMQMEAGLDTGPVFASSAIVIGDNETAGELHDRLATMGANLLLQHMESILQGSIICETQDELRATYAAKISRKDAAIDWTCPAEEVLRGVRAHNPVPGAFFVLHDEAIKCWRAELSDTIQADSGKVLGTGKQGIDVACGEGGVRLLEVQRPGRKKISATEFADQIDLVGQQFG